MLFLGSENIEDLLFQIYTTYSAYINLNTQLGMLDYTFDPRKWQQGNQEFKATLGGSEFEDSIIYMRPCLKNQR